MTDIYLRRTALIGFVSVLGASCTHSDSQPASNPAHLEEWSVLAQPELQIGVVEGDPDYQFHRLVSAVGLPNGQIAALDAGSHELRIYDDAGQLLSKTGRRGSGPGEFTRPLRVYLHYDTLLIFDPQGQRLSLHRLDGQFIATRPVGTEQWDEWLYDMSWIDGPPLGRGRAAVSNAVARLPAPDTAEGYRNVRVTSAGHLWVRQSPGADSVVREWHVYGLDAAPIARVKVPAQFQILDIGADYLLGRVRDSDGVEYLRRYRMDTGGAVITRYAYHEDNDAPPTISQSAETVLQEALATLAAKQEDYYSPEHSFRYASDHRDLQGFKPPKDVVVRMTNGHETGWTAIAMHVPSRAMCGMTIGTTPPTGWTPGLVKCF